MKVRSSIRTMCKHCYIVRRGKVRYVYCKETPKHKQRQGYHTMIHQGNYCFICNNVTNEISKLSVTNPVQANSISMMTSIRNTNPVIGINSIISDFSKKKTLQNGNNGDSLYTKMQMQPKINIKYIPEIGIFSIFNI